jgi:hypothetical protein
MDKVGGPLVAYFGYGSLVNRRTWSPGPIGAWRATLAGWRRHWQPCDLGGPALRDAALLSVHKDDACEIDGLLILDQAVNLAAIDRREARYDRIGIDRDAFRPAGGDVIPAALPAKIFLYVGRKSADARGEAKLLQSYLDVVLAGFLAEYGVAGIDRFMASTSGFGRPVIEDRARPLYSRAQTIDAGMARMFDARLAAAGARFGGGFSP